MVTSDRSGRTTQFAAFGAGAWAVCGMSALDWWERVHQHRPVLDGLLQVIALYVFVLVPAITFVLRPSERPTLMPRRLTTQFWRDYPRTIVRVGFWLLGAWTMLVIGYLSRYARQ